MPTYYAGNDPLLTYATPLHPQEEHTTSREELIGKVKHNGNAASNTDNGAPNASSESTENSTDSADLKSWSLDHAYLAPNTNKKPSKSKGKLVRSKRLDYKNIMWPRDALYISYKEENFEYINDLEAEGETAYYCDCCDPACQKKRSYSSDSSEASEDDEEASEADMEDEEVDKASTTSSSVDSKTEAETKTSKTENTKSENSNVNKNHVNQPGWFGKGRRKRARC